MRLALVAMSGVRAHDPELTKMGLTLPGFVERNKVIASLPSLGLLTLAGMVPKMEPDYIEMPAYASGDPVPAGYDLVAISSFSAQILEAYALADGLRALGTTVVLGGPHVTALPAEALEHADAVVVGEGEPSWPRLVEDFRANRLERLYDSRPHPFNLAEAPMPAFHLLDPGRYNRLTVQTQRGCPFDCEFCAASIRISPRFKTKPVAKVVAEIREIQAIWRRPFIEFADDNTFADKRHGARLMDAIAPLGIRWFTETDISVADHPDLLERMRDAGCAQILVGLESPSGAELRGVERHSNWKARQAPSYLRRIETIAAHGITINGCFVMGLDGCTEESFRAVADFVRASGLHEVQVTVQTPFPGTPLYERLLREHRIVRDGAWELCTLFDVNFVPSHMTIGQLRQRFKELVADMYSETETRRRRALIRSTRQHAKKPSLD